MWFKSQRMNSFGIDMRSLEAHCGSCQNFLWFLMSNVVASLIFAYVVMYFYHINIKYFSLSLSKIFLFNTVLHVISDSVAPSILHPKQIWSKPSNILNTTFALTLTLSCADWLLLSLPPSPTFTVTLLWDFSRAREVHISLRLTS